MPIQRPFFVVPAPIATVQLVGNERVNAPAVHLARPGSVGLVWRTNGPGNAYVRGSMIGNPAVDFMALLNTNAQPGTTVRLRMDNSLAQIDTDTASFDTGFLPLINPAAITANGRYHAHLVPLWTAYASLWRIDIGGHTGDFEAATLVLGQRIQPSRFYDATWERGVEDLGDIDLNRWGVAAEERGKVLRTLGFTLGWLSEAEYEASFRPMIEQLGTRGLVYCCFDPEPTAYRQRKTYFGRFSSAPVASAGKKPRTLSMPLQLQSLI